MKDMILRSIAVLSVSALALGFSSGLSYAQGRQKSSTDTAADKVEQHFKKAHESFIKKDMKAAAAEIRQSAAFLKREAERATGEGKKDLSASTRELEKLADDVKNGTVTSVKRLDNAFSRTYYALARNHYLNASESWAKKAAKDTGHDLKAASDDLERGLAWSGHKAETGTKAAIKDARQISGKLIKGAGWVSSEIGKGIEDMGRGIDKFGKEVVPKGK
ncbi:MAG: hypothetical protein M1510_02770 [Nitrospirae bacterium]|nr:hypothetical protein [Nitrospirota bacterium]